MSGITPFDACGGGTFPLDGSCAECGKPKASSWCRMCAICLCREHLTPTPCCATLFCEACLDGFVETCRVCGGPACLACDGWQTSDWNVAVDKIICDQCAEKHRAAEAFVTPADGEPA